MRTYVYTFRHPFCCAIQSSLNQSLSSDIAKRLPHIFLATKSGTGTSLKTNFLSHFDDDQRIGLEGNFNKRFIVYTHRRTTTDALSILAPNVMATLLDRNKDFNVEIVGDQLFLYSPDYLFIEADIRRAFWYSRNS